MAYILAGLIWFAAALAAGAAGLTARLHPPFPQLTILSMTITLLLAIWLLKGFRQWLVRLDWQPVVSLHLIRFVGFYFLYLFSQGELPYAFAVPGGWGDILVASLALMLLAVPNAVSSTPLALTVWNVIGLADILFVVTTAGRLGTANPASMSPLLQMPLCLFPTFFVPLIIVSHLWLLRHLLIPEE